jgi:16S rRNA (guanine527-N7)-methyltransferase
MKSKSFQHGSTESTEKQKHQESLKLNPMDPKRIAILLKPFLGEAELTETALEQVRAYLDLFLKWNAKLNLSAVRRPEDIVTRHFGESFFAAKSWLIGRVSSVIDLGSGAGFPGLPMAIYSPETKVVLIESQNKKATFLKEAIREMGLKNAEVFAGRGEDFPGRSPLVTMRAVEKFGLAVTLAAQMVEPGGKLGLMIGVDRQRELPGEFQWEVGNSIPGAPGRVLALGTRK